MSYSFSISGHAEDEATEWSIIQSLASTMQSVPGLVVSAVGNTQYHGVVDLFKVQTGTAINPTDIIDAEVVPEPPTEGENTMSEADNEVTSMGPETGTEVQAVDNTGTAEPVLNEAGEVVGFKEGTNKKVEEVLDAEGEVVGHQEGAS